MCVRSKEGKREREREKNKGKKKGPQWTRGENEEGRFSCIFEYLSFSRPSYAAIGFDNVSKSFGRCGPSVRP